jgi:hypothetical protein
MSYQDRLAIARAGLFFVPAFSRRIAAQVVHLLALAVNLVDFATARWSAATLAQ